MRRVRCSSRKASSKSNSRMAESSGWSGFAKGPLDERAFLGDQRAGFHVAGVEQLLEAGEQFGAAGAVAVGRLRMGTHASAGVLETVDQSAHRRDERGVRFFHLGQRALVADIVQQLGGCLRRRRGADQTGRTFQRMRDLFHGLHVARAQRLRQPLDILSVLVKEEIDHAAEFFFVVAHARQSVGDIHAGNQLEILTPGSSPGWIRPRLFLGRAGSGVMGSPPFGGSHLSSRV